MPKKLKLMWPLPVMSSSGPGLPLAGGLLGGRVGQLWEGKKLAFYNSIGIHEHLLSASHGFRHSGVR